MQAGENKPSPAWDLFHGGWLAAVEEVFSAVFQQPIPPNIHKMLEERCRIVFKTQVEGSASSHTVVSPAKVTPDEARIGAVTMFLDSAFVLGTSNGIQWAVEHSGASEAKAKECCDFMMADYQAAAQVLIPMRTLLKDGHNITRAVFKLYTIHGDRTETEQHRKLKADWDLAFNPVTAKVWEVEQIKPPTEGFGHG